MKIRILLIFFIIIIYIYGKYNGYTNQEIYSYIYEYRYNIKEAMLVLPRRIKRILYHDMINRSNCSSMITDSSPKNFISWNIQCLFFYIKPTKINNIINTITDFGVDLLCLQEVFEDNIKLRLINELRDIYPYYLLGNTNKKYILGEDSGLLILSKKNIVFHKEVIFDNCVSTDKVADKGIIYFSVGDYIFATSHTQADNDKISENQIRSIYERSPFNKYIILGDLNNQYVNSILNIEPNNLIKTYENEILDYIIPIGYTKKILDVKVLPIDITDITDHQPIYGEIVDEHFFE